MEESRKNVYFASDAHLGLDIFENPIDTERRLVRWMDSIKDSAKAIYFVGDMFDYWFEYKDVVPKGYSRFIGKMAELSDNGVEIHIFTGNHDIWMFGYFEKELGAIVHHKELITEIDGKKFYIAHGDGLGDPSISVRILRKFFRNKPCQALYKTIHPRLTVPLGYAWSRHNRKKKIGLKSEKYLGEKQEYLVEFAKKHAQDNDIDFYVFGHRHIVLDLLITPKQRVAILGDWIQNFSYGMWDGNNFSVEYFLNE
jgi:UDP-2,3-diacylglucosamine hydrolase